MEDFDLMQQEPDGCWQFFRGFGEWPIEYYHRMSDDALARIGIVRVGVLTPPSRKQ